MLLCSTGFTSYKLSDYSPLTVEVWCVCVCACMHERAVLKI